MRKPNPNINQLSFEALLDDGVSINRQREQDRSFGHLPGTLEEALPYFRDLLSEHHKAMLAGDADTVAKCRKRAHDLASKLNNFEPGIIADEQSPGSVLARLTRAHDGAVPIWGQAGSFEIHRKEMRVRIETDGLFGIGARYMSWIGFSAHAVEKTKPFLSETGYRSFLGAGGALAAGYTVDAFTAGVIGAYVEGELKDRLKKIVPLRAKHTPQ